LIIYTIRKDEKQRFELLKSCPCQRLKHNLVFLAQRGAQ
jgi:hypothetical protein